MGTKSPGFEEYLLSPVVWRCLGKDVKIEGVSWQLRRIWIDNTLQQIQLYIQQMQVYICKGDNTDEWNVNKVGRSPRHFVQSLHSTVTKHGRPCDIIVIIQTLRRVFRRNLLGNFTKYLEKKTEFEFADIICLNETTFFSIVGEEFIGGQPS